MNVFIFVLLSLLSVKLHASYSQSEAVEWWATAAALYTYKSDIGSVLHWSCDCCDLAPDREWEHTVHGNTETGTLGIIGRSGSTVFIAFRGSQNIKDFIIDAKSGLLTTYTAQDDSTHGKVGLGFYHGWKSVSYDTTHYLNTMGVYADTKIVVTGHSLGGALATLAAVGLAESGYTNIHLWTFGAPRIGNVYFADYANGLDGIVESWRVVNQRDMVPHLPSMGAIHKFHHIGTEVWYSSPNNYRVCNGSGEDWSCSDSLTFTTSVHDHTHYFGYNDECSSATTW